MPIKDEAAVAATTKCWWAKLRKCGEMLYGRRPLKLKEAAHRSYVRPAIQYESEAWFLKESEMGILWTKRSTVRAMCGVQLKDRKRSTDLMFMQASKETIDQSVMAISVCRYGQVLRREDGHVS